MQKGPVIAPRRVIDAFLISRKEEGRSFGRPGGPASRTVVFSKARPWHPEPWISDFAAGSCSG